MKTPSNGSLSPHSPRLAAPSLSAPPLTAPELIHSSPRTLRPPRPSPSSAHPAASSLPIFRQSPSASSSRTCAIPSAPSPSSTSPVQHRRRDRLRSSYSLPTKEFSSATPATSSLCSGIPIWARSGSSRNAAAAFPASGKASLSASPPPSRDTSLRSGGAMERSFTPLPARWMTASRKSFITFFSKKSPVRPCNL